MSTPDWVRPGGLGPYSQGGFKGRAKPGKEKWYPKQKPSSRKKGSGSASIEIVLIAAAVSFGPILGIVAIVGYLLHGYGVL